MKQAQRQLRIDYTQTITGFNPSFARTLFNELKALEDKNQLYTVESVEHDIVVFIKGAVCAYLNQLMKQVWGYDEGYRHGGDTIKLIELELILADADRFITTCEKK